MKLVMRSKTANGEPLEKRFKRFATALMAVPKKELDKELAKDQRKKPSPHKKLRG
jgi:hypothetical protein